MTRLWPARGRGNFTRTLGFSAPAQRVFEHDVTRLGERAAEIAAHLGMRDDGVRQPQ